MMELETYSHYLECEECGECDECTRMAYSKSFSQSMKRLSEEGQLCDARLRAKCGFELQVHSCFVSAVSPVIRYMLFNCEEVDGQLVLALTDVTEQTLRVLVDFAYTGRAALTQENVQDVLEASAKYLVTDLTQICSDYMLEHLNVGNCVSFMCVAKLHRLDTLQMVARRFVLWNFSEVYKNNRDFVDLLTEDDLASLLDDDHLNVFVEEEILSAIVNWVDGGREERSEAIPNLFSKIRLGLCFNPFPTDLRCPSLDERVFDCIQKHRGLYRTRVPRTLLFCIGGWSNGRATCDMEVFDVKAGVWVMPPMRDMFSRAYHALVLLGYHIYVLGGYDGVQCLRSVRSFDVVVGAWHERNAMAEGRCYVTAVALDGLVYAIGGFGGIERKSSCERFDPSTNQWASISPMAQARSDGSATAYSGKIIVCGGYSGQQVLSSSEIYDPETGQWTLFSRLPGPRSGHALFWFKHSLYLVAGHDGNTRLDSVYRYSFLQERWIEDAPLANARSNFSIVELEGKLYVIGGYDGRNVLSSVECYDSELRRWTSVPDLNLPRSASGACAVEDLLNARRYSANGPFGKNR